MRYSLQTIDALFAQRNIKKAEIIIAKLLRTTQPVTEQIALLIRRARTRLVTGRPEAALDDLQRVIALRSEEFDNPEVRELLGDCWFARFELAAVGFADRNCAVQAQQHYQWIVDAQPQYSNLGWVYYQLGRVLLTEDRVSAALDCFQRALLLPSNVAALTAYCYERLGFVAFYEERDFNRSLSFLNKAIDTYPHTEDRAWMVQVYLLRSRAYRELHRRDLAIESAEKALKLASSGRPELKAVYAEGLFTAAELLASIRGREKDVIAHLEQFRLISKRPVGIDVTWARIHEMLGDAYLALGEYTDAVMSYLAVLQFNPYHPWEVSIYYRIARAYYQQGHYDRAIEAVHRAFEAAADDESSIDYHLYDVYGNAHFALGHYEKAAEAYEIALRMANGKADNLDKIRQYYQVSLDLINQ